MNLCTLQMVRTWKRIGVCVAFFLMVVGTQNASARDADVPPIYASRAGAALDTDLIKGGGTDDTAALQGALDKAKAGESVHLVIDGPALVSGLDVYSNTTIECDSGGGFFLKKDSRRAVIRNAHRSRDRIVDRNVVIQGCFINGNREHQLGVSENVKNSSVLNPNHEKDGTFITGLQFLGIENLAIHDTSLSNLRTFGVLISNARFIDIRNITIDAGGGPNADIVEYAQTDGLHFAGPIQYLTVDTAKIRVGDDALAFNATETGDLRTTNEFGPYVGEGPITDVAVSNVIFMDALQGFRLLSSGDKVDRLSVSHVTGTVRNYLINVSHWTIPSDAGHIGSIQFSDVNVAKIPSDYPDYLKSLPEETFGREMNWGHMPIISINARADSLSFNNINIRTAEEGPVFRVGPDAKVGVLHADLTLIDPAQKAQVLKLDQGGEVGDFSVRLRWPGPLADEGKNPIVSGETAAAFHLHWQDTPPLFVDAHVVPEAPENLDVVFTQQIWASEPAAGAKVVVGGQLKRVVRAAIQPDGYTIRYTLEHPVKPNEALIWSYDPRKAGIRNLDGSYLRAVTEKALAR